MKRIVMRWLSIGMMALLSLVLAQTASGQGSVNVLRWMSGRWERIAGNIRTEELWMEPAGGTLLGLSRSTQGDTLVDYEYMRIAATDSGVIFTAHPSGQNPASFPARSQDDSSIVFENLQHDFPQRIEYRRQGADSLLARISGTIGGRMRTIDFPYRARPDSP